VIDQLQIGDGPAMSFTGSASWLSRGLVVHRLTLDSDLLAGELTGELGTGSNPALTARIAWSRPDGDWSGEGTLTGTARQLEVTHDLRGRVSGRAVGTGSLANPAVPVVDLQVVLEPARFGDTLLQDMAGRVSGTLDNLEADVTGRIATATLEPVEVQVTAYGPLMGPLTLRNVHAEGLGGRAEAQGSLAWRDDVRLLLGGTAEEVELAALRDGARGRVGGIFQLRFEDGRVGLAVEDLTGTVDDLPVRGEFTLDQTEDGWNVDPLRLNVGANRVDGRMLVRGDLVDLDASVAAPALEVFGLGVSGDATGSIRLAGRWPQLSGQADFVSGRIEAGGAALERAVLEARLDDGRLQAAVTAAVVRRERMSLEQVGLTADGTLERVAWRLRWSDGEGAGGLTRLNDGVLLRVEEARVRALDLDWSISGATELRFAGGAVQVTPVCIVGSGASACVAALSYAAGRLETRGRLDRTPVRLLQPWLPLRLNDGFLDGAWSIAGAPGDLTGELTLAARKLQILPGLEQGVVDLPDLEVKGRLLGDRLEFGLKAAREGFSVTGAGSLAPLALDGGVSAVIEAAATDLAPLRAFSQRIESLGGSLSGRIQLSGTLAQPRAVGVVRVPDGRLHLNDPDITLDDLDISLNLDDAGTFELRGTGTQRRGSVLVTGSGSGLFDGNLAFEAALTGSNVRAKHPDWDFWLSPDLTMTFAEGRGRVRGRVEVPRAELRLNALPTTVPSPSDDVVVLGREQIEHTTANPVRVDVDLVLGDNVVLKAVGIVAELQGRIRARVDEQGRSTLRGTLDVTGGSIAAQGQTLRIESGSVVYSGPVTRPFIDVRAGRRIGDAEPPVTVGLNIRGNADNLTSSLYSEPVMPETQALSMLVLGRDIQQETAGNDSSQLLAAAINLGLSRSQNITAQLMRSAGLDELSAVAEAENNFAIVAGKRVTNQLYVRYTYSTLSALGAFLVRYDIDRRWQLEAQSGEHPAMDLLYRFEK
jgi:translocation and assembly module TamB